jgi:AraC-like DNA-binding protein
MNNSMNIVQPDAILQNYIDTYQLVEINAAPGTDEFEQKPISNGCVEMFIGYHDTINTCYTNSGDPIRMQSALVGAHDLKNLVKGMAMETEPKICKFVSVSFKPHGFYGIFKIPPSELHNNFIDSNHLLGNDIKQLTAQLDDAKDHTQRKIDLDLFFISQLTKNRHKNYNIRAGFDIAVFIRHCKGNIRVNQLINEFKITERTLQRSLKTALGYTPKEYCKIIRFNNLINHVYTSQDINWLDMVNQFGYYDQAHMINEFKNATGITPDVFLKNKNKNIFKIANHLVILKPNMVYNEVYETMSQASYMEEFE